MADQPVAENTEDINKEDKVEQLRAEMKTQYDAFLQTVRQHQAGADRVAERARADVARTMRFVQDAVSKGDKDAPKQEMYYDPQLLFGDAVRALGVDPYHPDIDWAMDERDPGKAFKRIVSSAMGVKEGKTKASPEDAIVEQVVKKIEERLPKVESQKPSPPKVEKGGSSGKATSFDDIEDAYIKGTISWSQYRKAMQEQGIST